MAKVKIENQDVIEWAKNYKGPKFHALFCDAPYSLGDGKKGFMNKEWDNNIACNPDTWSALAEHLLPGAFLFVFAGTLNDDLISVAMRQAGLRKFHKAVLYWGNGAGFPKATNISKQIDGSYGKQGKGFITAGNDGRKAEFKQTLSKRSDYGYKYETDNKLAKTWAGHRYGLQSLKPSAETILIFMKPYEKWKKPVESITGNGAGALNIDAARILTNEKIETGRNGRRVSSWKQSSKINDEPREYQLQGRWPANLLLQHSPDCNGVCSPECVVRELDEQSGKRPSGGRKAGQTWIRKGEITGFGGKYADKCNGMVERDYISDTGGASRFFFNADWNHEAAERIEQAAAVRYCAKASRRERDAGLSCFTEKKYPLEHFSSGRLSDLRMKKEQKRNLIRNGHPTVKPLSLCKYLATLLLPPAEYAPRRICIPFAGVMSEAIGAMLAGWEEITAIEKEKEYCDIGAARVRYWQNHKEPASKKSKPKVEKESAQLELV